MNYIMLFIGLLLIDFTNNYMNFNQLRQDMQTKVMKIANAVQKIYQSRCLTRQISCPTKSFNICQGTGQRECLPQFPTLNSCPLGNEYSLTSGIRIPNSQTSLNLTQQSKYFICKTAEASFQSILIDEIKTSNKNNAWVYFGSNTGAIRISPGLKSQKENNSKSCFNYDPRLRQWYAASVYQRKKIIILVQNSKRIYQQPSRFLSMKLSLQAILKTSQPGDYFNVIEYSNVANALYSQNELMLVSLRQKMLQYNLMTQSGLDFYKSLSSNISKSRSSDVNLSLALQKASRILFNSKSQNPQFQNIILLLGTFPSSSLTRSNELTQFLQKQQVRTGLNFILFTFGINIVDNQSKILFKDLACRFQGVYIQLDDINYQSQFLQQAKSYYQYQIQGNQIIQPIWSDFYDDAGGLGRMTTVTKPAYYSQNNVSILIGVAAIDVLVSQMQVYKNISEIKRQIQITEAPFRKNITLCVLETIRRNKTCSNTCPVYNFCQTTITPLNDTVIRLPINSDNNICCIILEDSKTGLIVGLVIGISAAVICIALALYFLIFYKKSKASFELTYQQIFVGFKNFDQTRIRSDSQISLIKQ